MTIKPTFEVFDEERARKMTGVVGKKGIDAFLNIMITSMSPGHMTADMPVTDAVITFMGNMHGGCLSALCDHVLGTIMYPVMAPGSWAATTEFKINLLAPVSKGVCTATADIISMTRRLAVVRIEVENEGRLVAAAPGTATSVAPKA